MSRDWRAAAGFLLCGAPTTLTPQFLSCWASHGAESKPEAHTRAHKPGFQGQGNWVRCLECLAIDP